MNENQQLLGSDWCVQARALPLIFGVLALTLLSGCGRQPVSGEVTWDGKPVVNGVISFEPADGHGPTTGGKIRDGKYQLTGDAVPLPGKKLVRISAARKTSRQVEVLYSTPKRMVDEIERYIPEQYNAKTTLFCEIVPGTVNTIDFHLKSQ